ncbi:alpha/beta fold hydrolase [Antrihabitans cavernicola]|uniref:Alpha/beta hydrolase n=1 Tax=Antrihabitans cavernicola TaxID=2495913 RepID=A0A5A7SCW2_9NOCA|nr:alpha/beta hydrolase [Spelaeibacter cavernicola]KAA0022335.1 alpha/beta hydrolase [Spelaeibacter cavernicola]
MTIRDVISADGTSIVYRVSGPPDARPLVLLHGWAESLTCWGTGVVDELSTRYRVIAADLRGHGYSGAPESGYDDPENWAADIAAILDAESAIDGAVLLGWSYGGLVICDYLAEHGTSEVDGIILVSAINGIGPGKAGGTTGPAMRAAMPAVFDESPGTAVRAFAAFGDANIGSGEGKGVDAQRLFGASLSTPPRVRKALFVRTTDHDDMLRTLDVPALLMHGTADTVVDIAASEHAAALIPDVHTSYWDGAKHGLFIEDPGKFVAEVSEFIDTLA